MNINIYTDGSAIVNPGPGGWAAIIDIDGIRKEISGGALDTTNNRMELTAIIEGIKSVKRDDSTIHIWSDSQYLMNAISKGWLERWISKNFIKSDKKPVKNIDLWKEYLAASKGMTIIAHWIRGHNGHPENERCDKIAGEESLKYQLLNNIFY